MLRVSSILQLESIWRSTTPLSCVDSLCDDESEQEALITDPVAQEPLSENLPLQDDASLTDHADHAEDVREQTNQVSVPALEPLQQTESPPTIVQEEEDESKKHGNVDLTAQEQDSRIPLQRPENPSTDLCKTNDSLLQRQETTSSTPTSMHTPPSSTTMLSITPPKIILTPDSNVAPLPQQQPTKRRYSFLNRTSPPSSIYSFNLPPSPTTIIQGANRAIRRESSRLNMKRKSFSKQVKRAVSNIKLNAQQVKA
ncbi:hypothetical protein DM01DRAFT_1334607 [Hesseltinella vesiculosa]|uniref:Uncharacterized protein n=1 Tax=Hesseltinella vesiculosa TaxID=101127 RepID=A0A1X2GNR6_9FUNG|nr:hypothetical protein DM01DRAFT_1334607 [Hesseltinella vesiculosa]